MKNAKSIALFLLTTVMAVSIGVRADDAPTSKPVKTAVAEVEASGNAASRPTDNHVSGTVTFTTVDGGVKFVAEIDGFEPNEAHGFHIHEKGDLTAPDLVSAGGHYNPTKEKHGGPEATHHHAGDLGNLTSDANGHAHLEGTVKGVSLGGENSILDRSVIIHAVADDLKTDPSGKSGDRIAGGVIKAKAEMTKK